MKKPANSISGKFLIITLGVIVFWVLASLLFVDRLNSILHLSSIESVLSENLTRAAQINGSSNALINAARFGGSPEEISSEVESEQLILEIVTSLSTLESDPEMRENLGFQRRIRMIRESCSELSRIENEYISLLLNKGSTAAGLIRRISSQINNDLDAETPADQALIDQISKDFNQYLLSNNPDILDQILASGEGLLTEPVINSPGNEGNNLAQSYLPIQEFYQNIRELLLMDQRLGFYRENGLTNDIKLYNRQIKDQLQAFNDEFNINTGEVIKTSMNRLIFLLIIIGLLTGSLVIFFSSRILTAFEKFISIMHDFSKGLIPKPVNISSDHEFREISFHLNALSEDLRNKIAYAKAIREGNEEVPEPDFDEKDYLGKELVELHNKIRESEQEDQVYKEEEKKRNWHNEGMAEFGDIFRSEREDVKELAFKVIRKLVNYMDASQGSIFILNDENKEEPCFDLAATFAFDRRKFNTKKISPGEGLAGTCALEKQTIYLTDLPEDYVEIKSGLGESIPTALLIVPLKLENEIFGILEIASLKEIQVYEIKFVEQLAESIATTLAAVRINIKTIELLEQSQEQAAEMAQQEEKMRKSMQELERAQEESRRKEFEITGILNAVNASSMVAEFSLNGRFSEINEKFAEVLETSRDQIIGKHHSDFAVTDKYGDEYKKFWQDLRNGELKTLQEKFKLLNGKEIWLSQTYTPIRDNEGNTLKILNIAYDISHTRLQQESLEEQAREISRKNMEMRSLSGAVDESIIKCELDPEGVVIDVNQNYSEVSGYTIRELLGKNIRLFLKESEKEQFDTILSQLIKGQQYSGVVRRTKPTGEEVWLMSSFTPVKDQEENIYKIYFLAQDITEKKLKYQLLEEANREIERLNDQLRNIKKG